VHLFDIDIPGKMTFKESRTLTPGETPTVVDTAAGRLGVGICYDIRFPELAMLYAKRGVQVLVYPGGCHVLLYLFVSCVAQCVVLSLAVLCCMQSGARSCGCTQMSATIVCCNGVFCITLCVLNPVLRD
jgi:hypothetical protein